MIIPGAIVPPLLLWQAAAALAIISIAHTFLRARRNAARTTPLAGPPRHSWLFGVRDFVAHSPAASTIYEAWLDTYGAVYRVPAPLGSSHIVLADPKAIAHFYARETWMYVRTPLLRMVVEDLFGRGMLWAEGESHKRQRKALSPAFSNAAIRALTSIFYDSAYKLKTNWDNQLASVDHATIDVQRWMNHVSLDSIGIGGFSHDFGSLDGKRSAVAESLDAMGRVKPSIVAAAILAFGNYFLLLRKLPTEMRRLQWKLNASMEEIVILLLENTRREMAGLGKKGKEKSLIGLLIKAEGSDSSLNMSQEEAMAHMKQLILAGYETTSVSLTWALIELSRKPETQDRLRAELKAEFPNADPTWEQLTNGAGLRYLDAVVHEILRLHPPLTTTPRVAAKDDVIPLSTPLRLPSGALVDHIAVAAGQAVTVPIECVNTAAVYWGPDALAFRPERWLDSDRDRLRVQEIQGHRHLLTFVDGRRVCLGRAFALAEFKAVLAVLVKNFSFALPDGSETGIELCQGIMPRPRVVGETGANVPMRVRRAD